MFFLARSSVYTQTGHCELTTSLRAGSPTAINAEQRGNRAVDPDTPLDALPAFNTTAAIRFRNGLVHRQVGETPFCRLPSINLTTMAGLNAVTAHTGSEYTSLQVQFLTRQ